MNQSPVRPRCLVVVGGASGVLAVLTAFLLPDLDALVGRVRTDGVAPEPFEGLLVGACAVAALLAACWLWAVICVVALQAAGGRHDVSARGVPGAVRRLVLVACGVALAGAATVPAGAAPGTPGGIGGLPFPDRATGASSAPLSSPASPRVARPPRAGPAGPAATARPAPAPDVVVVRPGDTLWALATRHLPPGAGTAAVTACWQQIHELNRDVIGDDPDLIRPGQQLRLPRR